MWWKRPNDQSHNKRMQQISAERLGGQGDPRVIVQEVEVWPYE